MWCFFILEKTVCYIFIDEIKRRKSMLTEQKMGFMAKIISMLMSKKTKQVEKAMKSNPELLNATKKLNTAIEEYERIVDKIGKDKMAKLGS